MSLLTMLTRIIPSHRNLPDESPAVREADKIIDRAEQVTAQQEQETQRLQWRLDAMMHRIRTDDIAPLPPLPRTWEENGGRG